MRTRGREPMLGGDLSEGGKCLVRSRGWKRGPRGRGQ